MLVSEIVRQKKLDALSRLPPAIMEMTIKKEFFNTISHEPGFSVAYRVLLIDPKEGRKLSYFLLSNWEAEEEYGRLLELSEAVRVYGAETNASTILIQTSTGRWLSTTQKCTES